MHQTWDRIRHAVGFELLGLVLIVGILSQFGFSVGHVGVLGVFFAIIATAWNYVYNLGFDRWLKKSQGHTEKTQQQRLCHALGFEFGLLWLTIPALAWWLNISLWQAFVMDIGLVVFYLIYAYFYNLAYDRLFPIPV
ncbi:hypothetical protein VST7929_01312 [Vibrio stylophorae]|uniref:Chlorhexidine efflux transporter domain-containing protein n=1 Tax=Vibrio stylophorae TaxID=659351 RepID=A0ABN8DXG6_9VIBR|nr:PACE efflux transporter [Vibrio stylophorae]CAH0533444.1 hypothetical protein VST7929_01312 [Vibrio stylophorae]